MCSWILWLYSMYLMQRKPHAHAIVTAMQPIRPLRCCSCAQRTAHAAVRLEKISTPVLIAPNFTCRYLCAYE